MSGNELYLENGELPPQGIHPEKSGIKKRQTPNRMYEPAQATQYVRRSLNARKQVTNGVVIDTGDGNLVGDLVSLTDNGYYRFGEYRYPDLWPVLDILEDTAVTVCVDFSIHFAGHLDPDDWRKLEEFLKTCPRVTLSRAQTPAMSEQKGVGNED